MRTATATYHAPEGDAKSCTMNGVIFNDGETVELNSNDNQHLISKLRGNQHFEFDDGEDDGEQSYDPTKVNMKDGMDRARDYSFERDQRQDQADRDARALAAGSRRGPGRPSNAEKAAKAEAEQKADEEKRADAERKEAQEKAERDRAERERVEAERRRKEDEERRANQPSPLPNVTPVQ
jgi:membrane protein involved in colicin uptake